MLYSIDTDKPVTHIPHRENYDRWIKGLKPEHYKAIMDELHDRIEREMNKGNNVHTSSWIPGSDWSGTVYQPIYSEACGESHDAAKLFFGLLVWVAFMKHPDYWGFGRYEKDGISIEGMTYFKVHPK